MSIFKFQKGGLYFIIYLWGFAFVISTAMMFIHPVLIAPLFNKFTPVCMVQLIL